MRTRLTAVIAIPVALAIAIAGCSSGTKTSPEQTSSSSGGNTSSAAPGGTESSAPPAGTESSAPPAGGDVVQGASVTLTINGEPTTMDPQARDDGNNRDVADNIYEKLLRRSPDGSKLEPWLATELPTQVNPTTWEFKLRQGVKFTDGEPFNAESAVWSIKRMIDPKFNSELISSISTIVDAKAKDEYTLDVITKEPDPILPSRMYFIGMMAPKAEKPDLNPVGTGAYMLDSWTHGTNVTLKVNPDYWGDKPSITSVKFTFPQESGTRLAQLLSGQTDLVTNLLPNDAKAVPQLLTAPGTNHAIVILNNEAGVTANVDVRKALNYGVNTAEMAKTVFGGYATPDPCQVMDKSWFGFNPDLQPIPFDQAKAKELVEKAGAKGKTINMVADASGRWLADRDFAQAVAQAWREIGLTVNVEMLQFGQYLDKLFNQPERPDAIILYTDNSLFDADRTVTTYYAHGGSGASNNNQEVVKLANEARQNLDQDARLKQYQQIMQIGCDQAMFYFGPQVQDLYGASKRVTWTPRADSQIYVADMSVKTN